MFGKIKCFVKWLFVGEGNLDCVVDEHEEFAGDVPSLEELNKKDLIEYANAHGINIKKSAKRQVIVDTIEEHFKK